MINPKTLTIEQKAMLASIYADQASEELSITDLRDYRDDLHKTLTKIDARLEAALTPA